MVDGGLDPGEALGSGQKHVVGREGFRQLRADHAHVSGNIAKGQRQHRHDDGMKHGPGKVIGAAVHHQGAPPQPEAHHILQKHRVHKGRDGNENHDEYVDDLILPLVFEHGGNHAKENAEGHRHNQRQHIDIQRGRDFAGKVLLHRLKKRAHRGAEAPVEAGEQVFEKNAVLHNHRIIVSPGPAHVLQLFGVPAGDGHHRVGQHTNQHKKHRHDDKQAYDEQTDSFAYVLQHLFCSLLSDTLSGRTPFGHPS